MPTHLKIFEADIALNAKDRAHLQNAKDSFINLRFEFLIYFYLMYYTIIQNLFKVKDINLCICPFFLSQFEDLVYL